MGVVIGIDAEESLTDHRGVRPRGVVPWLRTPSTPATAGAAVRRVAEAGIAAPARLPRRDLVRTR